MEIKEKEKLLYSARKAINELEKIRLREINSDDLYYVAGTAVHWLMDCIDRIPPDHITEDKDTIKMFSAMRYANNCLKHNVTFVKVCDEKVGAIFPIRYPIKFSTHLIWSSADNIAHDAYMKNQKENYCEVLEGKDMVKTMVEMLDIIKKYY